VKERDQAVEALHLAKEEHATALRDAVNKEGLKASLFDRHAAVAKEAITQLMDANEQHATALKEAIDIERQGFKKREQELRAEIESANHQIKLKEELYQQHLNKMIDLEDNYHEELDTVSKLQQDRKDMEAKAKEREELISSLRRDLETATMRNASLAEELDAEKTDNKSLRNKALKDTKEIRALNSALAVLEASHQSYKDQMKISHALTTADRQSIQSLTQAREDQTRENKRTVHELQIMTNRQRATIESLEREKALNARNTTNLPRPDPPVFHVSRPFDSDRYM
jgi:chromosome segregation ATPase